MSAAMIGIVLFPLMVKALANIDVLENLSLVIPGIIFTVGLGYMVGIWLNLFLYDKGLKEAETFLDIVEKYSSEKV